MDSKNSLGKSENVMTFQNEKFGTVRTVVINGEPWFVGKDVAEMLGYESPRSTVSKKVDLEDCGVAKMETPSGIQEMTIINESGLYSLILSSKLPQAKEFKHWVTSEVLPSIRKTGNYSLQVPQSFAEALRLAAEQQERIEAQQKLIAQQKPKADYFDKLVDRNLLTNFRDTAKEIGVGQNELIKHLLEDGYLFRDATKKLKPYMEYVGKYFQIKDTTNDNTRWAGQQTLVTPEGKEAFRLLYGNN